MSDTPKRTIDERLDALTQTMELLQAMQKDNLEQFAVTGKRVDELAALVATHEQEWNRFRRAMRAAFKEWMDGENGHDN